MKELETGAITAKEMRAALRSLAPLGTIVVPQAEFENTVALVKRMKRRAWVVARGSGARLKVMGY